MCTSCRGPRDGFRQEKSSLRWAALRAGRCRRARSSGSSRLWARPGCSHSLSSFVTSVFRPSSAERAGEKVNALRIRSSASECAHTHTGVTGRLIFSETVSASREMSAASSRLQLIYSEFCSYHQNIIIVVIIIISDNNHHIHRHVFRLASWKHESGMKLLFGNVSSNRE